MARQSVKRETNWGAPLACNLPEQLDELIHDLTLAVRSGELKQLPSRDPTFAPYVDVSQLLVNGTWPDYFELYFQDTETEKRYRVLAETYHWSSVVWDEIPD